jgi:ribonuclease-3
MKSGNGRALFASGVFSVRWNNNVGHSGADDLEAVLGHSFHDRGLLNEALTHPSLNTRKGGGQDYQRLEFVGDRVLGLLIAEELWRRDEAASEGDLAVRLNALVRRDTVAEVARSIGLGDFLQLGRSEIEQGGRDKAAILADVCEAVLGALYLDGGIESARSFVSRAWSGLLDDVQSTDKDAKTRLQEFVQAAGEPPPSYRIVERTGPDHAPCFKIEVTSAYAGTASGLGGSRREAEQEAAAALLDQVFDKKASGQTS